jgi:uncharacterized membrane protein
VTVPSRQRLPTAATLLVLVILALGGVLRVHDLGEKLVWHDEVATVILAAGYPIDEWKEAIYTGEVIDADSVVRFQRLDQDRSVWTTLRGLAEHDPQHPPLYYALASTWVRLVGDGIGPLRLLSVLASLLGLVAMFQLCWEVSLSKRVAWTGTALLSVSPFFVLYAQEAREYALWATLILGCTAALLRAIRQTEATGRATRAWALYGLLTLVGLYTSLSTAPVIGGHVLFVVLRERGRLTRVALSSAATLAGCALLFLPWALNLLRNYDAFVVSMRWSKEIIIPRGSLLRILALNLSRPFVDFWPDLHTLPGWIGVGCALAVLGWAVVSLVRQVPWDRWLLIACVLVLPTAVHLVPDLLYGGIRSVSTRYLTPTLLMLLVTLAVLLGGLKPRKSTSAMTAVVFAVLIASCWHNARLEAPWSKGVSTSLPQVARVVNASEEPLLVAGIEAHMPGNMLALSRLLRPDTRLQLLTIPDERAYELPDHAGELYFMGPNVLLRQRLEDREQVRFELLVEDLFLQLWRAHPGDGPQ